MDSKLLANLLDPPILFFFFGMFAAFVRSNLDVPQQVAKFLSLYLLMAIGFKGGVSLAETGLTAEAAKALGLALLLAFAIPAYVYAALRRRIAPYDAAAVAATYGSVSAVTFIAATSFLAGQGVPFGGYMTVCLVLMESPAIIMAVLLANVVRQREQAAAGGSGGNGGAAEVRPGAILHEAFTDGAHLLLLGSLVVGAITGEAGKKVVDPFTGQIFKGMLGFFLLEMGLLVARRLRETRSLSPFLVAFALAAPLVNAALALLLARLGGLGPGDATLLAVLAASGSYIVVPAVVRYAIPEANPSVFFTMSLAITFPFNISLGIPLYHWAARTLWGS